MKIWMITSKSRYKAYESVRFKEEAKKLNLNLKLLLPEKFEIVTDMKNDASLFYNEKPVKLPEVLIPRHSVKYFTRAVVRQIEQSSALVLNRSHARSAAKDKMASLQMLRMHGLPVPKTMLAKYPLNVDFVANNLRFPIIIKRTDGSEGKGIILCNDRSQLEDIFEMMEGSLEKDMNIILQEFVSESFGKDIRVFVVGKRAIGAMLRKGKHGDFKANYSGGGTVESYPLTPELEMLAVEASSKLGLDIAGVDVLFGKEGYTICEVNASPYFEGFEKATGINVPEEIFKYMMLRLG